MNEIEIIRMLKKLSTKRLFLLMKIHLPHHNVSRYNNEDRYLLIAMLSAKLTDSTDIAVPTFNFVDMLKVYASNSVVNKISKATKLSDHDVKQIRIMKENNCTFKDISERYNISIVFARNIVLRKVYKHVE